MSLSGSRSRLSAVSKELEIHWRETKNYWRDTKSQEFEQRYMDELLARVVLNFSRTTATEFLDVDVHQVINETLSLLEHQFKKAQIRIESRFEAETAVIFGNPGKLQQVFLNLFLNARDAMADGGELCIRTECVDAKLEITVKDTGTG